MKTLLAPTVLRPPARLGTRTTVSQPPALTGEAPVQPRVRAGAAELRARREADLHRALARLADTGTAVRVGRYSLVGPRQDPADRLAETQAVVHRRRWTDSITTFDITGAGGPALRPQMARLFAALDAGEIHGIVAVSQVDISPYHDIYAHTLAVLRARRGFLALARSETSI
ncbi:MULTISPECIES: hypothetical protein [Streptomyces]|uniref:hypothetical protein n=1 Tax=Streptomyces TaxID=1883 RepID=UPI0004C1C430|nr:MULTISPECIES: hypothetical protein [Streptomyces]MDX3275234.1 hypothetical protein [Streptomyces scabiei]MDX3847001.1 hypothetical protein [Streptomyces europaeiscabiei]